MNTDRKEKLTIVGTDRCLIGPNQYSLRHFCFSLSREDEYEGGEFVKISYVELG